MIQQMVADDRDGIGMELDALLLVKGLRRPRAIQPSWYRSSYSKPQMPSLVVIELWMTQWTQFK